MSAVHAVATRWHGGDGKLFSPDLFGSFELFWEFLRLTSVIERVGFVRLFNGALVFSLHSYVELTRQTLKHCCADTSRSLRLSLPSRMLCAGGY